MVIGARSRCLHLLTISDSLLWTKNMNHPYKSESTPKYDTRPGIRARCNINGAVLVSGSATPSIETYYKALNGKNQALYFKSRPNELPLQRSKSLISGRNLKPETEVF